MVGMPARTGQAAQSIHAITGHARSNATGTDLALPDSVVSAGNGTQGTVTSEDSPFKVFHSTWSGYLSGVAASFNFEPIMDLFYQGSVFTGASAAQAYMNDSAKYLTTDNPVAPIDCSNSLGVPCQIIGYETTTGLLAVYNVARINQCVIETGFQGDADQISANEDTVTKTSADIFALGVAEAQAACTAGSPNPQPTARPTQAPTTVPVTHPTEVPTSFQVVGCFQKGSTQPSASPTCLHSARHGQKVKFEVYTTVQSAPLGSSATVGASITRGSSSVRSGNGSFTTESGVNLYAVGSSWTLPKKKGTYTLHAQTSINGVTESDTEKLKVT
jgi:hypothetical protein